VRILRGGAAHGAAIKLLCAECSQYREMKLEAMPMFEIAVTRGVGS
jgi:hypothetical protein